MVLVTDQKLFPREMMSALIDTKNSSYRGWRANCDIQLIIDHHACVEYLAKYASKGEKISSVARDALVNVISNFFYYFFFYLF